MMTKIQNLLQPKKFFYLTMTVFGLKLCYLYQFIMRDLLCRYQETDMNSERQKRMQDFIIIRNSSSLNHPPAYRCLPTYGLLTASSQSERVRQTHQILQDYAFVCFSDDPQIDSNNNPFQRAINMRFWTRISISLVSTWVGLVTRSTNKTATDKS